MLIQSLNDFYSYVNSKKIILFGTGEMSRKIQQHPLNVEYYIDNDSAKWGKSYLESIINSPNVLLEEDKNNVCIIIASMYFIEISEQLEKMGFEENIHFFNGEMLSLDFDYCANRQKLICFKNFHRGERAFIIGSGPSLKVDDLGKLKNEVTFACNKIYLAFEETDWRPTYYAVIDSKVAENNAHAIESLCLEKFVGNSIKQYFSCESNINWLNMHKNPITNGTEEQGFSKDISKFIFGGYTVTYVMIQMAYYMGIRELYLLGVDFSFEIPRITGEKSIHGEVILESQGEVNHFHPNYRAKGEKWTMPKLDEQYRAFLCAKKVFEESGGKIYNASRKTKLDIFPIVNLDEIL